MRKDRSQDKYEHMFMYFVFNKRFKATFIKIYGTLSSLHSWTLPFKFQPLYGWTKKGRYGLFLLSFLDHNLEGASKKKAGPIVNLRLFSSSYKSWSCVGYFPMSPIFSFFILGDQSSTSYFIMVRGDSLKSL